VNSPTALEIDATEVFEKNWDAIHALTKDGKRRFRFILNRGSSRSSKTVSILQAYWLYALKNGTLRMSVWRDTKKICKDTVGFDMQRYYPGMPYAANVTFNQSEYIYKFPNDTVIELCGTDDAEKIHGYNGDVLWLNEPYKISYDTFTQLAMRCTGFIIIDMNPKMKHWADDLEKDPRTIVINSTFRDNAYCPEEQRLAILGYQPVEMCALVLDGKLELGDCYVYDMLKNPKRFAEKYLRELSRCLENERKQSASKFNWQVYGLGEKAEKPNRIFNNWKKISNLEYDAVTTKKYAAVDWGEVDPWGILEGKWYDGTLYLHELNYMSEEKIRERMTFEERAKLDKVEEGLVKYIFDGLKIEKGRNIICDDNRAMKVVALREGGYYMAQTATKGPGSILEGINLLNKIKVKYTESSRNLEDELDAYEWIVVNGVKTEEAVDAFNHLCDPARYLAIFLRQQGIIKAI
jgi:hypothetical protein